MPNLKKNIGGWEINVPEDVFRLGIIVDSTRAEAIPLMWKEAEAETIKRLTNLDPTLRFFEETYCRGDLTYSFRYYTPMTNRKYDKHKN